MRMCVHMRGAHMRGAHYHPWGAYACVCMCIWQPTCACVRQSEGMETLGFPTLHPGGRITSPCPPSWWFIAPANKQGGPSPSTSLPAFKLKGRSLRFHTLGGGTHCPPMCLPVSGQRRVLPVVLHIPSAVSTGVSARKVAGPFPPTKVNQRGHQHGWVLNAIPSPHSLPTREHACVQSCRLFACARARAHARTCVRTCVHIGVFVL